MFFRGRFLMFVMGVAVIVMGALPALAQDDGPYNPVIDPAHFVEGVDNPYFPLIPGTTLIYEGTTEDGTEHIEVSVTDETRKILGVDCVVVHDTASVDGVLVEDTYDWYAQDMDGNVWYMGEDTRAYHEGTVSTAGSWEAGVDGAKPGIVMQAALQIDQPYRQEYYAGEAEDMAQVLSLTESVNVTYGSYDHLLMTKEWSPLEPDVTEHKYYAEGIGLVLEETVQGGSDRTELINIVTGDTHQDDPCAGQDQDDDALEAQDDGPDTNNVELECGNQDDANDNHEAQAEDDEQDEAPSGTAVITADAARQTAEAYLNSGSASQVELDDENGCLIYSVEIGSSDVKVDALTGDVLGIETDDE